MANHEFTAEFEFKASRKMLFPYLTTASGLAQWFADDVTINEDKVFSFAWDGEEHQAKLASQRVNRFVRFDFLNGSDQPPNGTSFLEMRLDTNDLTGAVFLNVTDSMTADDEEEFYEIWLQLTDSLKEIVGG
ncbi:START-like domain-containing protein [Tunicatimonas pelagia]|uniref:START-like domain-containing protein n=1 Tax=Tunicatimonas pelagia TaxID=931531 RepID=UPI002666B6D9|nr:START-like domain-containing protein [Tunicatimonas pelagia]WKN44030.1 START-like domain-containing protein [Tunicatimonas pelagia]